MHPLKHAKNLALQPIKNKGDEAKTKTFMQDIDKALADIGEKK